jgi:hypothetical protein
MPSNRGAGGQFQPKAAPKANPAQVGGGIGPSTIFAAPADDPIHEGDRDWAALTVNGKLIPEHLWGQMPYDLTDQGIAEEQLTGRKAELRRRGDQDPTDKAVDRYRDQRRDDVPLRGAMQQAGMYDGGVDEAEGYQDPFQLLMKEHLKPGERGLMMSTAKCAINGMYRGTVGIRGSMVRYEAVVDAAGKRVGLEGDASRMFLAQAPADAVERAMAADANQAREQAVRAQDRVRENSERLSAATRRRVARESDVSFEGLADDTDDAIRNVDEFTPQDRSKQFVG